MPCFVCGECMQVALATVNIMLMRSVHYRSFCACLHSKYGWLLFVLQSVTPNVRRAECDAQTMWPTHAKRIEWRGNFARATRIDYIDHIAHDCDHLFYFACFVLFAFDQHKKNEFSPITAEMMNAASNETHSITSDSHCCLYSQLLQQKPNGFQMNRARVCVAFFAARACSKWSANTCFAMIRLNNKLDISIRSDKLGTLISCIFTHLNSNEPLFALSSEQQFWVHFDLRLRFMEINANVWHVFFFVLLLFPPSESCLRLIFVLKIDTSPVWNKRIKRINYKLQHLELFKFDSKQEFI